MNTNSNRRLALFGATGSIGRQTLEVIEELGGYDVTVLSAGSRVAELSQLALKWRPEWVTLADDKGYNLLRENLSGSGIHIEVGPEAAAVASTEAGFDVCVNGLVGVAGLLPSYNALVRGIDLALANKESLVLAGEILNKIASQTDARILPVDSEHSAIWQCLQGERKEDIARLILTASGGPFRDIPIENIQSVTADEALKHPTWKMGPKISIDSATLMNKGLEVIEAYHLFEVPPEKIDVRIHPDSIVHSMVEFIDGSYKAQLGFPDMRHPISYALGYPIRLPFKPHGQDPTEWKALKFYYVDKKRFPCLELAFKVLKSGGTAGAVLNGADEAAVKRFLNGEIGFCDIYRLITTALEKHDPEPLTSIEQAIAADRWARDFVREYTPSDKETFRHE